MKHLQNQLIIILNFDAMTFLWLYTLLVKGKTKRVKLIVLDIEIMSFFL